MVEARIQEAPETAEEEFGLVEGPLGHLTDEALEEKFFSAAAWEQLSWERPTEFPQGIPATDLTLQL